jgi:hypothetical protein
MAKFKMIALTTPVAGREEEFHVWYQNVHLPELCTVAGLHGAQRYKLVTKFIGEDTNQWLAIYDIECDDPMTFLTAMGEAAGSGRLTQSDSSDMGTTYTAFFSEYGERVEAKA